MSDQSTSRAADLAAQQVEQIVKAASEAAERIKADARIEAKREAQRELDAARKSATTLVEDAHKEAVQIREQTQRSVEGRVAAAEQAAAEVLEEARTLHSGMRSLGETLSGQAERMLRDVQAAHKRMQADLRISADVDLVRGGRPDPERGARRPAVGPRVARPDERQPRSEGRPAREDEPAPPDERSPRSSRRVPRLGPRGPRAEAGGPAAEDVDTRSEESGAARAGRDREAPADDRPLRLARSSSEDRDERGAREERASRFQRGPRDQRVPPDATRGPRSADPSESERIIAAAEAARAQGDRPQAERRGGPLDDLEVPSWVARKR